MIINIEHYSRKKFLEFAGMNNDISPLSHAFISIYGTEQYEKDSPIFEMDKWNSGIFLRFDDATGLDNSRLLAMTDKQADHIIEYMRQIHASDLNLTLIIHCYAGLYRSAAVGKFINDYLQLGISTYNNLAYYNDYVYRKLMDRVKC